MLLFLWLDFFPFRGLLFPITGLDFTLCYIMVATFYYDEPVTIVLAGAAGAFADAASGAFIHIPAFFAVFFAARILKKVFYRPGSAFHVISYIFVLAGAEIMLFIGTARSGFPESGFPALFLLRCMAINFLWFLLMLLIFRERSRAVLYKMR